MSALGQKQTYAVHKPMSALLSIATAKANYRKGHVRFTPKSRHVRQAHKPMSALCQERTFASLFQGLIGLRSNLHSPSPRQMIGIDRCDTK